MKTPIKSNKNIPSSLAKVYSIYSNQMTSGSYTKYDKESEEKIQLDE